MIRTAITDKEVCREFAAEAERRGFAKPSRAVSALALERLAQLRAERAKGDAAPAIQPETAKETQQVQPA